tara:strand:- start:273 stop:431 length:159 start_codon:yes stop_codon:yes gene_type:complete
MKVSCDRWIVSWKREKKGGYSSTQKVVVYGIENVEHVINTMVPTDEWSVTPA